MLAAYALNSGMGNFDLDRIAVTYLGETPPQRPVLCFEALCDELTTRLEESGQTAVFRDVEMPLAAVLWDMERLGFKIDRDSIREYGLVLDTVAADMETRIYTYAGKPFNINSPKQLGEILFETLMLPTDKKTKTGYSTGAEVLEKLRKYHPIIDDILEYRQVTKLKSTYVDGLLKLADENGLIHTTFKQTGTATGRLSSAEPNLQNIPIRTELGRELRKFFIPSAEGRVLIDADYSQIELRLLADIAGDTAMRDAFVSGFDIHTDTASRIFGVEKDAVTVEMRKRAKAVNFGIMYGMGEHSLSEDLHISRAEAKAYIESYLNSYPDVNRYLDEIIKSAYAQGFVTTKLGRRRFIPELAESNKMRKKFGERVAMNSPIQGTAADIIKLAMIRVRDRLKDSGLDARMILQVHDELILEASREDAEAAMTLLREEMEHAVALSVPLDVEAHVGESWFEAH
jgi:DNA polymerase-1